LGIAPRASRNVLTDMHSWLTGLESPSHCLSQHADKDVATIDLRLSVVCDWRHGWRFWTGIGCQNSAEIAIPTQLNSDSSATWKSGSYLRWSFDAKLRSREVWIGEATDQPSRLCPYYLTSVPINAQLVRRSRIGACFSPRQQEAAPDGEEQTQTSPENSSQAPRS
jgi:hypothetical protein